MKALKALVAFMGVLLIAGLALLGYGLYDRAGKIGKGTVSASAPISVPLLSSTGDQFGQMAVSIPAGAHIEQSWVVGPRLVLRLTGAGPDRLLVLDPANGQVAGTMILTPDAPVPTR